MVFSVLSSPVLSWIVAGRFLHRSARLYSTTSRTSNGPSQAKKRLAHSIFIVRPQWQRRRDRRRTLRRWKRESDWSRGRTRVNLRLFFTCQWGLCCDADGVAVRQVSNTHTLHILLFVSDILSVQFVKCEFVIPVCTCNIYWVSVRPWERDPSFVALPEVFFFFFPYHSESRV